MLIVCLSCSIYFKLISRAELKPAAAGPRATRQPLGAYSSPLYFCDDIVVTRRDREVKLCTRLPEYLAEVVSKFSVEPI